MRMLFTAAALLSAALLFLIQPMMGKLLLPRCGGAPAVWNTCMVFFQILLLASYAYAHGVTTWLGVRRQAALHAALLLVPLVTLPIGVALDGGPPAESNPVAWVLGALLASVGLPFF